MSEAANISAEAVAPEAITPETPAVTPDAPSFSIPESYADSNYGEKIKSSDDLWKAYHNSQKLIGDRGAHIPQEGASEDDVSAFIDRLDPFNEQLKGKFAAVAPEEYTFSDLELPDGVNLSDDLTTEFSAMAKDLGLTNDQADGLRKRHITQTLEREKARQETMNEEFDTLGKGMWGDQYEAKLSEAITALDGKLDPKVAEQLWNAEPSILVPILGLIHAKIDGNKPDSMPTDTSSHGMNDEQLKSKRMELRKIASQNPTKANMEAFNKIQEQARGK